MRNIEWTDVTWNPVTGCPHNCKWTAPDGKVVGCYARAMSERFHMQPDFSVPIYQPHRHHQPDRWVKPRRIFVCSMGDLFAEPVPDMWIGNVLRVIKRNPRHTFLLLTKNPERVKDFYPWPGNLQLGQSVDGQHRMLNLLVDWISFEPLTEHLGLTVLPPNIRWVVIGALSAGARKYQPTRDAVTNITEVADRQGLPVFMKNNLDCEALGIPRRLEVLE